MQNELQYQASRKAGSARGIAEQSAFADNDTLILYVYGNHLSEPLPLSPKGVGKNWLESTYDFVAWVPAPGEPSATQQPFQLFSKKIGHTRLRRRYISTYEILGPTEEMGALVRVEP
jgi:hypothetical protein